MARPIHDALGRALAAVWVCLLLAAAIPAAAQIDPATKTPAAPPVEAAAPVEAADDAAAPIADGGQAPAATPSAAAGAAAADGGTPEAAAAAALQGADLEALVQTLENEAERTEFVTRLKDLIAAREALAGDRAEPQVATITKVISEQVERASEVVVETVAFAAEIPALVVGAIEVIEDPAKRTRWLEVITNLAIVLGAAFVVEWVARALLSRARRNITGRPATHWPIRLALLVLAAVIELVPIAAFAATAYSVLPVVEPKVVTRLVAIALINANVLARLILLAMRVLVTPNAPNLRLFPMSDGMAQSLYRWSARLTNTGVYGYFGLQAALLLGLPRGFYLLLLQLLGLAIAIMLIVMVFKYRSPVAVWIRGSKTTVPSSLEVWARLRRRIAEVWHLFAVLYVVAVYFVWTLGVSGSLAFMVRGTVLSVLILIGASIFAVAASRFIERWFREEPPAGAPPEARPEPPVYVPLLNRIVDLLVYATAVLALLEVWGVDIVGWLSSDSGKRAMSSLFTVVLAIAVSFTAYQALSRWIERYLAATDESGEAVERGARAKTLLPLAKKAVMVLLIIMATFITLSELGIDIAPLIAGAGVLGIAIGFGAQSLVRDVITGFFILLEDTFSVGQVVDLGGGNAGLVEVISIRTVKLRDLSGTVHTVPFGDVTRIKNLTKDFSYYLMDVGVAYREDVDQVIQVLRDLGAEMQEDIAFKFSILEPIEILGVDQFADSAVIIKARIKTRPIRQWAVGREFNRRMKIRFDELGIEIPFPHQTLYFGVDKDGSAPPANIRLGPTPAAAHEPPTPAPAPAVEPGRAAAAAESGGGRLP